MEFLYPTAWHQYFQYQLISHIDPFKRKRGRRELFNELFEKANEKTQKVERGTRSPAQARRLIECRSPPAECHSSRRPRAGRPNATTSIGSESVLKNLRTSSS